MAALNLEASSLPVAWSAPTDLQRHEVAAYLRVTRKQQGFLDVHSFRRAWRVPLYAGSRSEWSPSTYDDVKIGQDNGLLKLATAEEPTPQEIPLKDLLSNLKSESEMELPDENLTVDFQHGKRAFRVVFDSIALEKDSLTARIDHCTLYLLEK